MALTMLGLASLVLSMGRPCLGEPEQKTEYQVKAAFLYNFMKFTDGGRLGPAEDNRSSQADPNNAVPVGILGRTASKQDFQDLQGKEVAGRRIVVRRFKGFDELTDGEGKTPGQHPNLDDLRKCDALFICSSERAYLQRLLPDLQSDGVLMVGDVPGFLQAGGVINFVIEENKVRFEVNLAAAARAGLKIRSSLLRLAIRIVEQDRVEDKHDKQN